MSRVTTAAEAGAVLAIDVPGRAPSSGVTAQRADADARALHAQAGGATLTGRSGAELDWADETATFDGHGVTLTARNAASGSIAPAVTVRSTRVGLADGRGTLVDEATAPVARPGRHAYGRPCGVVERYDELGLGVEQIFILTEPIGDGTDVVLEGALGAEEPLGEERPDGEGGFDLPIGDGTWWLHYGAASAYDADGTRLPARLDLANGEFRITLSGTALAAARYPVVVDPIIVVFNQFVNIDNAGTTDAQRPAIVYDYGGSPELEASVSPQYHLCYGTQPVSRTRNRKILCQDRRWDGVNLPGSPFEVSSEAVVDESEPTIAFKFGRITATERNKLIAWQRADGKLGYAIYDRDNNPLVLDATIPPDAYDGSSRVDPDAASNANGTFDPSPGRCDSISRCDPYLIVYRRYTTRFVLPGQLPITSAEIRLAVIDEGTGAVRSDNLVETLGELSISGEAFGADKRYAPHIAYGHSERTAPESAQRFVLVYRKLDGSIVARKVDEDGSVGTPLVLASSSSDAPRVAYGYAANAWAIVWRQASPGKGNTGASVRIVGQILPNAALDAPESAARTAFVVATEAASSFSGIDPLPDYAVAGSFTPSNAGQGTFVVAYVRGDTVSTTTREIYRQTVNADGTLAGSVVRLTKDTKEDRFVDLAMASFDPIPGGRADYCSGAYGSRCMMVLWEQAWSNTDHDILGYWTRFSH